MLLALLGAVALPQQARAARGITRAITDDVWFTQRTPQAAQAWVTKTSAAGVKLVLLEVDWVSIEPHAPPAGVDPMNPAGPEYSFSELDARVREFQNSGMSVAFLVGDAPRWAETPGGPAALEADGAWKPKPAAFGQMAQALATRYSGSYPDPLHPGQTLPRVRYFQAWGEVNLNVHLAPQWVKKRGKWQPFAPNLYRSMLNAFYTGVKSVHQDDEVITGGLAPYGDPPGGQRTPPVDFLRTLLCLSGTALHEVACPNPAHYDVLASDPYDVGSPTTHAVGADNVSAPDLGRLTRVERRALATGRALPRAPKQLWVTEFGYDSKPGNPYGLSPAKQARWLEESYYVFWSEGVNTAVWYLVRDQAAKYNPNDYYSGLYFHNGTRKPSFTAYRFPFVVMPYKHALRAWGISPTGGTVVVQRRKGHRWVTISRLRVASGGVFVHGLAKSRHGSFRAIIGKQKSLVWSR